MNTSLTCRKLTRNISENQPCTIETCEKVIDEYFDRYIVSAKRINNQEYSNVKDMARVKDQSNISKRLD